MTHRGDRAIRDKNCGAAVEQHMQQRIDAADMIEGTVFEVSEEELFFADQYEPENYQRVKVVLQSGKEAWVYAADEIT